MQGFERMDREFTDAELLAGHLVPAGSMFAFLAAHRAEVFPDADYADLFAAFGRPSLPATRMAAVLALQALHDFSDRETAEAVRFDVRWKVACGLAIDDQGFDPSSLVYWRGRIARSGRPHRVNEAIRLIVEQTGVLKGAARGGGLHDLGRCGRHPRHDHPAGLRDPAGGARGARRGGADRAGVHRP